jgi:predicted TIM-barrel fold metal-dependent hydrolase
VRGLVGSDRILFGTDFPLLGIDRCARQVRESGLPPDEVEAILGGNAARLLLGDTAPG